MNRRDLVAALAERTETDKRTADVNLQAFIDTVTDTVASGEVVVISGFAKFARVDRAARMGRNPQTGEAIRIKASRRARVTPLKAFKDAVLAGKRPAKKAPAKKAAPRRHRPRRPSPARHPPRRPSPARRPREEDHREEDHREEDHPPVTAARGRPDESPRGIGITGGIRPRASRRARSGNGSGPERSFPRTADPGTTPNPGRLAGGDAPGSETTATR